MYCTILLKIYLFLFLTECELNTSIEEKEKKEKELVEQAKKLKEVTLSSTLVLVLKLLQAIPQAFTT